VHPLYNGWLYTPNKTQDLTRIFDDLFLNPGQLKVFGQNSRQMSLAYDIHTVSQKLQSIYTNVITK
jgi:hypothetical protein